MCVAGEPSVRAAPSSLIAVISLICLFVSFLVHHHHHITTTTTTTSTLHEEHSQELEEEREKAARVQAEMKQQHQVEMDVLLQRETERMER